MTKFLRRFAKGLAITFLALVLIMVGFNFMFNIGTQDVKNFCEAAKPGTPLDQLDILAEKFDVNLKRVKAKRGSGHYRIIANNLRSYGRYNCFVEHDGNIIVKADVEFFD